MSDNDERENEQVRVSFQLAADCKDETLQVPSDVIAIPSHLGRKGLSTVINHLLGRRLPNDNDDDDDDDSDEENRLESLPFEFLVGEGNNSRLLRTSVEKEARQNGLSLEDALVVTYFPAQQAPAQQGEEPTLPDWISAMSYAPRNALAVASYDGSLRFFDIGKGIGGTPVQTAVAQNAHQGPVKCLRTFVINDMVWTASGSMDHSLALHAWPSGKCHARKQHKAAVASLDERIVAQDSSPLLASGDWEGGLFLCNIEKVDVAEEQTSSKKRKTGKQTAESEDGLSYTLSTKASIQAHQSKISGISWGNYAKQSNPNSSHLITGSWDHSIKVWDVQSQDCLLTLNGSKVVSCMDTSHHTADIVATGHPDCTVRLWDVRTDQSTNSLVSDSVFRPSHQAWISQVSWSISRPYQIVSSSHDGTAKIWDIRASLPLHTLRVTPKEDKVLAMSMGYVNKGVTLFAGGTDCKLKQFSFDKSLDEKED